jgi:chromosome segregation ATPase
MDQELLKINLSGLERKLHLLVTEHKNLKESLKNAQSENQTLRQELTSREQQISGFQNQFKIAKLVDNIDPEGGNDPELKRRIDEYIKEIDKCIAHLSR